MPLTDADIARVLRLYRDALDRYRKLTQAIEDECRALLDDSVIPGVVQARTKGEANLEEKLRRRKQEFHSADDAFARLSDLAAVRIITYVEGDRSTIVEALVTELTARGNTVIVDPKEKGFYRATHCQVTLGEEGDTRWDNLAGHTCEVQVCSLLAHTWAELEHDLTYKKMRGEPGVNELAALNTLGNLLVAGDGVIQLLLDASDARLRETKGTFTGERDFVARIGRYFPSAENFPTWAGQLLRQLTASGLNSPERVRAELFPGVAESDFEAYARAALLRIQPVVTAPSLTLDEDTSDLLLAVFLDCLADDVESRRPGGKGRPERIFSIAKRVYDARQESP